jgi:hypothetical protein
MKNRNSINLITTIVSFLWTIAPINAVPTETPISPTETNTNNTADVQNIVSYLVGVMDTSEQAATNKKVSNVRMTTCKIAVVPTENNLETDRINNNSSSVFLYQEQAITPKLNEPYRQRFLEILAKDRGVNQVESKSYKPIEMEKWIGFCDKTETERIVSASELGTYICSVLLKQSVANYIKPLYIGETQTGGCPANVRGATSISNTIYLFPDGMNTWDRGFDANGTQVWGAANEAYKFRKRY